MKNKIKVLLVGSAIIASGCISGFTNSASADIYHYDSYARGSDFGGGENLVGYDLSWTYQDAVFTANLDGMSADGGTIGFTAWLEFTNEGTETVAWTFETENAYWISIEDLTAGGSQMMWSGDTFIMEAGHSYKTAKSTYAGQSWEFVPAQIPAPGALALLGIAGITTRRRRK